MERRENRFIELVKRLRETTTSFEKFLGQLVAEFKQRHQKGELRVGDYQDLLHEVSLSLKKPQDISEDGLRKLDSLGESIAEAGMVAHPVNLGLDSFVEPWSKLRRNLPQALAREVFAATLIKACELYPRRACYLVFHLGRVGTTVVPLSVVNKLLIRIQLYPREGFQLEEIQALGEGLMRLLEPGRFDENGETLVRDFMKNVFGTVSYSRPVMGERR